MDIWVSGGKFLYAGPDRMWTHKIYAGKRGVGIARNERSAVVWREFLGVLAVAAASAVKGYGRVCDRTEEIDRGTYGSMKGLEYMSEKQDFIEMMNDWGFSVNARINFNNFINAVETEDGLISAVQKMYQIIDDIVLKKGSFAI